MTRQAIWQARMIADGRCRICGQLREKPDKQMCKIHREESRKRAEIRRNK